MCGGSTRTPSLPWPIIDRGRLSKRRVARAWCGTTCGAAATRSMGPASAPGIMGSRRCCRPSRDVWGWASHGGRLTILSRQRRKGMSGRRGLIRLCGFGRVVSRITRLFRVLVGSRMVVGGMTAG